MSTARARPVIGLTGGIGSGKSAAADLFAGFGADVVDTDLIAHQLTAPGGAAMAAIAEAFGAGVVRGDGALDRDAMRALAFDEPGARARLEGILHPLIRSQSERQIAASEAPYVVLVVPLLVEAGGYRERVDRICVVDVPEAEQMARVMARNGFDEARVRAIMAAQASRRQRLAVADDVIDNSGSLLRLREQVEALHHRYMALA
ncbi:MAG: dephospho-CoA kinase [Zoogloeaceae bacterium]|nr:dephospho-CoA kinase [Rhodocyclaceae bacterium]MCP5234682.1 dephospho-CoA kinase [Zoogloeaceae bacterium]